MQRYLLEIEEEEEEEEKEEEITHLSYVNGGWPHITAHISFLVNIHYASLIIHINSITLLYVYLVVGFYFISSYFFGIPGDPLRFFPDFMSHHRSD